MQTWKTILSFEEAEYADVFADIVNMFPSCYIESTGGGMEAFVIRFSDGHGLLVTDLSGMAAPMLDDEFVVLALYDSTYSDEEEFYAKISVADAVAHIHRYEQQFGGVCS